MTERMAGNAFQGKRDVALENAIDGLMRQGLSFEEAFTVALLPEPADAREVVRAMRVLEGGGSDPRDYETEPGLWRSQLLPLGVTIDQAIKDGVW